MIKISRLENPVISSLLAFGIKLLAALSSYVLLAVIARLLSPTDFGVFSFYFSAAMLGALVGCFGQQVFLIKEVPAAQLQGRADREKGVYRFSLITTIIAGLITSLSLLVILPRDVDGGSAQIAFFSALLCFLYSATQSTMGALRVQNRTLTAIATRDLLWRVVVILLCWLAIGQFRIEGVSDLVLVFAIMSAVLFGVLVYHLRIAMANVRQLGGDKPSFRAKPWFSTSLGLALVGLISGADLYLYTLVMGMLFDSEVVGAFFAALKTAELINLFLMTVLLVVAPRLSRAVGEKRTENLQLECNAAIVLIATPTVFASIFMLIFAPYFMLVFDPSFVEYDSLLRLLVLGMLVNALSGATGLLLQLGGMHWWQIIFQGGSLLISIILLPIFVYFAGVVGAALSFILAKVVWNALAVIAIRSRLGVDPSVFSLMGTPSVPGWRVLDGLKQRLFLSR